MDFYVPIFSKIVDSSLWDEEDWVVKIFLTMLAKKDGDHVVRGSAYNIACWAKKTEKEVLAALKILSSPDRKRIEKQPYEGRRIQKVPDGWLMLNGEVYKKMAQQVAERARKARWAKENRAKEKEANNLKSLVEISEKTIETHKGHIGQLKKQIESDQSGDEPADSSNIL